MMNQKLIMSTIHNDEPTRNANAVILPKKYRVKEAMAKTFTNIIMIRISNLLMK
jgi:hypothetical protein